MPSEEEIMSSWQSEEVKVSVLCVSYNHEKYLPEAIESFLTQKTDFAYEIVIHDDASTDGSASVIKYYQSLYPNIIKPILQQENQYSKAPNSIFVIGAESCSSEYIALCEGDDYWISKNKLQVQYEFLKQFPDLNMSFHSFVTDRGCFVNRSLANKKIRIISHKKMVLNGPTYVALASVMAKKEVILDTFKDFSKCPVGDFFLQIMASWPKGALYIAGVKSYYRTNSLGSWTETQTNQAIKAKVKHWSVIAKHLKMVERKLGNHSILSKLNALRLIVLLSVIKNDEVLLDEVLAKYLNYEDDLKYKAFFRVSLYKLWRRPAIYTLSFFVKVKNYIGSRLISLF
jgi:glycosyltransferase involved in cell wall biosynthesis